MYFKHIDQSEDSSDYFADRVLLYVTDDEPKTYVSARVAQCTAFGPLLWNVMYDTVLRPTLPFGAQAVGYRCSGCSKISTRCCFGSQ